MSDDTVKTRAVPGDDGARRRARYAQLARELKELADALPPNDGERRVLLFAYGLVGRIAQP